MKILNSNNAKLKFVKFGLLISNSILFFCIIFSSVAMLIYDGPKTVPNAFLGIEVNSFVVFSKILSNNQYQLNYFGIITVFLYISSMILAIVSLFIYIYFKYSIGKSKFLILNSTILLMTLATFNFLFAMLLTPLKNGELWYEANAVPRNIYFSLLEVTNFNNDNILINKNGLSFGWYKSTDISSGQILHPGNLYYTFIGYSCTAISLSLFVWISNILKLLNPGFNTKNDSAISYKEKNFFKKQNLNKIKKPIIKLNKK